jgi:hypothetical protein
MVASIVLIVLLIFATLDQLLFSYTPDISATQNRPIVGNIATLVNESRVTNNTIQLQSVSSIEGRVKIINEKDPDNWAGLFWFDGNKSYYLYLHPPPLNLLSLYSRGTTISAKVFPNVTKGIWYSLKVEFSSNAINIFLNNRLTIHEGIQTHSDISSVGIQNHNNIAKFEPILIKGSALSKPCTFPEIMCLLENGH